MVFLHLSVNEPRAPFMEGGVLCECPVQVPFTLVGFFFGTQTVAGLSRYIAGRHVLLVESVFGFVGC